MNNRKIKKICKKYGIENYTINDDVSIDVDGNVYLGLKGLNKLHLKFRNVSGGFYCFNNKLTLLEGCPESVGGDFYCHNNKLTSLVGCPESVGGNFDCSDNKITTFEHLPLLIGDFYCDYIEEVKDYLIKINGCCDYYFFDLNSYNKRRKRDELLEKLLK